MSDASAWAESCASGMGMAPIRFPVRRVDSGIGVFLPRQVDAPERRRRRVQSNRRQVNRPIAPEHGNVCSFAPSLVQEGFINDPGPRFGDVQACCDAACGCAVSEAFLMGARISPWAAE